MGHPVSEFGLEEPKQLRSGMDELDHVNLGLDELEQLLLGQGQVDRVNSGLDWTNLSMLIWV